MPVFDRITSGQFAVDLGVTLNAAFNTLNVTREANGSYTLLLNINFPKIKEFDASDPLKNIFTATEGSYGVYPVGVQTILENIEITPIVTTKNEAKFTMTFKVPGSGKGNHG